LRPIAQLENLQEQHTAFSALLEADGAIRTS
jgi:hypothetical protein